MRTERFKGALVSTLLIASLLTSILVLTRTAEAQVPSEIVMKGKDTAYNISQTGDPPWYEYEVGDLPVIMVAKEIGSGGVVAAGIVPTVRSSPTPGWTHPANPLQHLDILFDEAFRWMVPGAVNVLWYQGYNVYNTIDLCYELVEALGLAGYTVTPNATQPITSGLLSAYDILVLPQLQLGTDGTGGDPDLLPDADVQAIKSFVEGGGGLFIMDGSDFGGHHYSKVMNKILEGLGFDYFFQDDQVSDPTNNWDASDYRPIADVDTTTDIGSAYQAGTGTTEIGLYSICSLARGGPGVSLYVLPDYQVGMHGDTIEYTITVSNPVNPLAENLTYNILAYDNADWGLSLENNSLFVPIGEYRETTLSVAIPADTPLSNEDTIVVTAVASEHPDVQTSFTTIAHAGKRIEPFDDVYVSDQDNDANYSGENSLRVGRYYEYWQWPFLKFDLSGIPPGTNITEARLYLYAYYKYAGGFDVLCHEIENDDWTETTITWNTKPTHGALLDTEFVDYASFESPKSYSWDVTSFVKNEFAGNKRASFLLRPPDNLPESPSRAFWSRERYENRVRPFLRVSYITEVPEVQRWDALITATFPEGSDDAIFGVRPDATAGFDSAYDIPEPPPPWPPYVQAFFHYPGNAPLPTMLHRSSIKLEDIMQWPLRVSYHNGADNITLSWSLENVPADYAVLLFKGEDLVADMRTVDNYTFQTAGSDFDFTIRVAVVLAPPKLMLPPDSAVMNDNTPTFRWDNTYVADNYEVFVDNDNDFSFPEVLENITENFYTPAMELWDGSHWWRVRAYRGASVSDFSEVWTFIIDTTPPAKPTLAWPVDGENISDNTPNLDWEDVEENTLPVLYQVFISDNFAFPYENRTSPWVENDNWVVDPALSEGVWYWLVRARDNVGNVRENSDTSSFRVDITAPSMPTLLEPANGMETTENTPTFRWIAVTDVSMPVTYELQVDNDADFGSPEINVPRLADNTYTPSALADENYSWRVRAVDNAGNDSAWSSIWTLLIKTIIRGVEVSISPESRSGAPGETLTYTVTVANTGNVEDTYDLAASDTAGWTLTVSPASLTIPAGESDTATLGVTIPLDASLGDQDTIEITATSRTDSMVWDTAVCTAQAMFIMGVEVSISPGSKSGAPGETLTYEVTVTNRGNVEDNYSLTVSDNENWSPSISQTSLTIPPNDNETVTLVVIIPEDAENGAEDNITVTATGTGMENSASCVAHALVLRGVELAISPSYQSSPPGSMLEYAITVSNTGNVDDDYDLSVSDNEGWEVWLDNVTLAVPASESRTTILHVQIPGDAIPCTEDDITVTATSQADPKVTDENSCIAHALAVRGVKVSISPPYQENLPGGGLTYNVIVTNTGNIVDNYALTLSDNENWGPMISPTSLLIAPGASDSAILSVIIPDDAVPCTRDNITVTATSQGDPSVSGFDTCIAHATEAVVPSAPTLKSPTDGTITNDNTPTFEWTAGLNADNHQLLVDNDPDFTSPIENRVFGPTDNTYTPVLENSFPDDNYSWKVIATSALGENQSSVWTFVIDTVPPAAPSLISPANGTITDDNTPTFDWSDVTGAENYDLLVDDDANFSSPEIQVTVSASTYKPTAGLPDGSYSWKVRARDAAGNIGDWSSTWTLIISVARGVDVYISPSYQSGLPGATLSYSVTVKNEGNISDTFDLTDSAGWGPTLSRYSLALGPKAYDTVTLTVTIPTDASVGDQDNITITAKSTVDQTVSDSARCTAQATALRRRVEASISPDTKSGPPRETLTYTVTTVNEGDAEDTYDLTVTDALAWGASVSPNSLTIAAGGSDTATVSVVIPAGTASGIEDEITVTATSRADLTVGDSATCIASAAAVMGVKVSISPETKSGPSEEMLTYEVTVKNEGNVGDTYILSTAGAPDWSPRVENTSLTLNAGEVGETTLTVTIPPGASEGTSKTVTVTAISVGDPTVVGSVTCRATVKGVPEKPEELLIPLVISAFLIGAAILTTADLLRVRSRKAARRRVLRGPRRF